MVEKSGPTWTHIIGGVKYTLPVEEAQYIQWKFSGVEIRERSMVSRGEL